MTEPTTQAAHSGMCPSDCSALCKHCGGPITVRNPTGKCDHLYWPDMLTDEAKKANGFVRVMRPVWEKQNGKDHAQ